MKDRPRGYGHADLLNAVELAAYLHCGRDAAVAWARARGLAIHGPGRAALFVVGEVLAALEREGRPRPPNSPRRPDPREHTPRRVVID